MARYPQGEPRHAISRSAHPGVSDDFSPVASYDADASLERGLRSIEPSFRGQAVQFVGGESVVIEFLLIWQI